MPIFSECNSLLFMDVTKSISYTDGLGFIGGSICWMHRNAHVIKLSIELSPTIILLLQLLKLKLS